MGPNINSEHYFFYYYYLSILLFVLFEGSGLTVLRTADRLSGRVAWGVLEVGEAVLAPPSLVQGDVADLQLLVNPAKNGKITRKIINFQRN